MGLGKARDGVKQEEDIVPLIPEVFGGRYGTIGGAFLGAGRFAGRRRDHDRFRHDRLRQDIPDKLIHLAGAFADQRDDDPVCFQSGRE